jgi:hypothetical protein
MRRLEIATWSGAPVRDSEARDALAAALFGEDGDVMVYQARASS